MTEIVPIPFWFGPGRSWLLIGPNETGLIDTGFWGSWGPLTRALERRGRTMADIDWILLTHGHLDHTQNACEIRIRSGAPIHIHPADRPHLAGTFAYEGRARLCGFAERIGRVLSQYSPVPADHELAHGQRLDCAGGLRVLHLPGHTQGHCGFFHEPTGRLFAGDLVVGHFRVGYPPAFLNSCPQRFPLSFQRVRELAPSGLLLNHGDNAPPEVQLQRFHRFVSGSGGFNEVSQ